MARKRKKAPPPTREEVLTERVRRILSAEVITPGMVYDILLSGHSVYKQGVGIPQCHVLAAILKAFEEKDRRYLTPWQVAALNGRDRVIPEDYKHLEA